VIHVFDRERQQYVLHPYEGGKWTAGAPTLSAGNRFGWLKQRRAIGLGIFMLQPERKPTPTPVDSNPDGCHGGATCFPSRLRFGVSGCLLDFFQDAKAMRPRVEPANRQVIGIDRKR